MDTLAQVQSIKAVATVGGILPAARSAGAVAPTGIDRTGFQSCQVIAFTGADSGSPTARSFDAKLQDNTVATAGDGGWADADACGLNSPATADLAQIAAVNSEARKAFNLNPAKQFIRVHGTVAFTAGTSPTLLCGAVIVLGGAVDTPVAL